ncbi:MAG: family 78 glycoside hydrolase catalytic domain [Clostridia bacterium]|nr:family 78 glycoside hydrolase catalytic domain [Clostridia bacterium]
MHYQDEERAFAGAKWICGGDAFLESLEQKPAIAGTHWIWQDCRARAHLYKTFALDAPVSARACFLCDNPFALFLNGVCLARDVRAFDGDVTAALKKGENTVFLACRQTDADDWFSSALCGKIEGDGLFVPTDASWTSGLEATGGEDIERQPAAEHPARIIACPLHPRAQKRSLYFRKQFFCPHPVTKAALFVSEEGETEVYCNGSRTDDELLPQGTCADPREFREIDITNRIVPGENVIGCLTGNGWLNSEPLFQGAPFKNRVMMRLVLSFDDGGEQSINTDETWKCAPSPLYENDLQYGERYDARREIPGWCRASFDDTAWTNAVCEPPFSARLIRRVMPPIRVMRTLAPQAVWTRDGAVFFDFGETVAGRYRLRLTRTRPGQRIKISFCERLDGAGKPVVSASDLRNFDLYLCKGGKEEVYEPRFAFNGFRYLYVTGTDAPAQAELTAHVWHNALAKTGTLQSRYRFLRELYRATERTMEGNCFHGFLNCPTREKTPASDVTQIFAPTACFLADCSALLARWTDHGRKTCSDVYGRSDELYLVPWTLYRFYGDRGILEARRDAIFDLARRRCESVSDNLPEEFCSPFNDRASVSANLPPDFFAHAYFCYMLKIVTQIAEALGDFTVTEEFAQKLENARYAFRRRYFLPLENDFAPRTQSALVLPLAFDILPPHRCAAAARTLRDRIYADGHITTGVVGTRYILNALCENGQTDAAFFLLDHEAYPSWKAMLKNSITLTEGWRGAAPLPQNSINHVSFGTVTGWMFECLAGIRPCESEPGFAHVVLKPSILPQLGSFKADFRSVSGPIRVEWRVSGDTVTYAFSAARSVTLIQPDGVIRSFPSGTHKAIWRHRAED